MQIKLQNTIKQCDWCHKPFDFNDNDHHYYDAQQDCYFCSKRCLYDSFFDQIGDPVVDWIEANPEYEVIENKAFKKAGAK
ncbi:hypothetical protein FD27_GL001101 [Limosilactobacillus frumenti DSM 13145]|uniref:Uncharacterized protein n=1 Tax=Limosilactobacillus frumenti DSM 13145 TaxID=1423746 RepID=A0A0R1P491_9LACO|nr:hypothetical protein [Limosilactobacillus frumenti]KRL27345.1 hypothetical protein FD27_GL001101 [Limosilactobacillus frumenti DSM 13145]QFG72790.1 hypothetical protein LF145_05325 [Limosilactobacillus frumenti]